MDLAEQYTPNVEDVDLDAEREAPEVAAGVHRHGYVARLEVLAAPEDVEARLRKLGPYQDSSDWRKCEVRGGGTRWHIRGSTSVTQRQPRNPDLPLWHLNRNWKTNLYSIIIERYGSQTFIDLHGVRPSDVDRLLGGICGLLPEQYALRYFRRIEVYVVLSARDAHRLAKALAAKTSMRGNKHRLVDDHPVPVTIRSRTRVTARLTLYRVPKGPTVAFKLELALVGRRDRRQEFTEADAQMLEEVLLNMVATHGVTLQPKPALWEPRGSARHARDPRLSRLGRKAYRGNRISREYVEMVAKCHTPDLLFVLETGDDTDTCTAQQCIRSIPPDCSGSSASPAVSRRVPNSALWRALAGDIVRSKGLLSEVLLPPQHSPEPFLDTLVAQLPGEIAVSALCAGTETDTGALCDTWYSLGRLTGENPLTPKSTTLVVVVDPSLAACVTSAVATWDRPPPENDTDQSARDAWLSTSPRTVDGPLIPAGYEFGPLPFFWLALAARFDEMLSDLRHICEEDDSRVVLVTVDARPHADRDLARADYFRDGQVRSILGDAARYHCHNRYLVERRLDRVVMLRDSSHGLMGRIVF